MPNWRQWAGRGLGVVEGKGHSHPRRATRGAPVCTCPGPLPLAQPVCGERALVSRVGFFVPAHARPILTDRVRPSDGQSASASLPLPAPSCPGRASPFLAHVVSPPPLGSSVFQIPCTAGFCTSRGTEVASPASASGRARLPTLRTLVRL